MNLRPSLQGHAAGIGRINWKDSRRNPYSRGQDHGGDLMEIWPKIQLCDWQKKNAPKLVSLVLCSQVSLFEDEMKVSLEQELGWRAQVSIEDVSPEVVEVHTNTSFLYQGRLDCCNILFQTLKFGTI